MNTSNSQSQPTQFQAEDEKSSIDKICTEAQSEKAQDLEITSDKLIQNLRTKEGRDFEITLKDLASLLRRGTDTNLGRESELLRKLMNHFTRLSHSLESEPQAESRMLFVLSVIAQIIKREPRLLYPFTRKFLLNVFTIDSELLQHCPYRSNILAILAVVYNNLARQGRLVKKLVLESNLKRALLQNFYLIEQIFTLKLFNQSILLLQEKGVVSFTRAELSKFHILETIAKFIAKEKREALEIKMKVAFGGIRRQVVILQERKTQGNMIDE